MPVDETHRRRKSSHRRKKDTSTPHVEDGNHDTPVPHQARSLEQPNTIEDLQKAQLKYLATPNEQGSRGMKYEYTKTVKANQAVNTEPLEEGPSAPKTKSASKIHKRSSTSKASKSETKGEDEGSQYVYGPPRSRQHVPGAFDSHHDQEERNEKSKRTIKSTQAKKNRVERRNTEPVARHRSTGIEFKINTSLRPALRKSVTTLPERPQPMTRRSSVASAPKTETATVVSTATIARKSGSVLGSLFSSRPAKSAPIERRVSCLTCGDDVLVTRSAKLPCTHRMCYSCLKRIFKLSVTDPAHMPPRCCTDQPISLKHVETLFDNEFKKIYNRKFKEFSTRNKIYCPARGCGEWIQPKHITTDKGRKVGRCPACKTSVCAICGQKMHRARDCPKDPATKEFAEAAKKAGWQKCYNCAAMVELKEGCNHMTCRCTAEFCMMCGQKWKSCDCPWFNYENADVNGDPVRYQQEIDRRREQEERDEAIARRLEALQLDNERPALAEWFQHGNPAGRRANQNFVRNAREALTADFGEGPARRFPTDIFAQGEDRVPTMPGAWDDGPQQFEQMPPLVPRPVSRRHQRNAFDPAAQDQDIPRIAERNTAPVFQHRSHRRRGTDPAVVTHEARGLDAEERDQQRRIRAWATAAREDR